MQEIQNKDQLRETVKRLVENKKDLEAFDAIRDFFNTLMDPIDVDYSIQFYKPSKKEKGAFDIKFVSSSKDPIFNIHFYRFFINELGDIVEQYENVGKFIDRLKELGKNNNENKN